MTNGLSQFALDNKAEMDQTLANYMVTKIGEKVSEGITFQGFYQRVISSARQLILIGDESEFKLISGFIYGCFSSHLKLILTPSQINKLATRAFAYEKTLILQEARDFEEEEIQTLLTALYMDDFSNINLF